MSSTPPQDSTPTRNRTPRKKLIATLGVLTGLLLLLVIAWAIQWFRPSPAIRVSRDTTFVTEPIGPDGLPDLRRARMLRNGHGLTADENGAATLFQAIGRDGTDEADWPALAETLQIDPASVTGRLGTQDARFSERLSHWLDTKFPATPPDEAEQLESWIYNRLTEGTWRAEACPPIAELIHQDAADYDRLYETARRPGLYVPPMSPFDATDRPDASMQLVSAMRDAVRALNLRSMLRMGEQDWQGAWEDIRLAHELPYRAPSETYVMLLVQLACEGHAASALDRLLCQPDLPAPLAREIRQWLPSLPTPLARLNDAHTGERLFAIESLLLMQPNPGPWIESQYGYSDDDFQTRTLLSGSINWNVVLTTTNEKFDEVTAITTIPDWRTRQQRLSALESSIGDNLQQIRSSGSFWTAYWNPRRRSQLVANELAAWHLGTATAIFTAIDRLTAERELRQVAAALAVFRIENGSYPRSLAELIPHLLDEVPVDAMNGEPIRYSPDNHGSVLLHSLGPNGKDDAGSRAVPSIFRGLYLHDWSWYEEPGSRVLLDELSDAGHAIDADSLSLDPKSLIDPDADDFSWRSLLPQPDLDAVIRSEQRSANN